MSAIRAWFVAETLFCSFGVIAGIHDEARGMALFIAFFALASAFLAAWRGTDR